MQLRGGELTIRVLPGKQLLMTGAAETVCEGTTESNKNPLSRLTVPALPSRELASSGCEVPERVPQYRSEGKYHEDEQALQRAEGQLPVRGHCPQGGCVSGSYTRKRRSFVWASAMWTQPLAKCVVQAMRDAAGDGHQRGLPATAQARLPLPQAGHSRATTPAKHQLPDEIFISDGAKSDLQTCWGCSM